MRNTSTRGSNHPIRKAEAPAGAPGDALPAEPVYTQRLLHYTLLLTVIAIAVASAWFIADCKLALYRADRYLADLFTYDQMLQESLRGHLGLEFTYGNQLGDHAYWTHLLLLVPLKAILGKQMAVFLVVLGPIVYCLMGIVLFIALASMTGSLNAFFCALLYFLSYGVVKAMCDGVYGCHFDTFAGFIAMAWVALLAARWRADDEGRPTRLWDISFWVLYALYIGLKEEMALLGLVFFMLLYVCRRNRFHLIGLAVTAGVFGLEMILIKLCQTEWNRTNVFLLKLTLQEIADNGLIKFLFTADRLDYWLIIFIPNQILLLMFLINRKVNIFALGLYLMGLAKMALNLLVVDTIVTSWHNYPGVVMMLGGLILQLEEMLRRKGRGPKIAAYGTAAALGYLLLVCSNNVNTPFLERLKIDTRPKLTLEGRSEKAACLKEIKAKIDPKKVIDIHGYTGRDWVDGFRYTYFPHGLFWSPQGIADYIVLDRTNLDTRATDYLHKHGQSEFALVFTNDYFYLFKRKALDAEFAPSRERFIKAFGADTIGAKEQYPIVSPTNREGLFPMPNIR